MTQTKIDEDAVRFDPNRRSGFTLPANAAEILTIIKHLRDSEYFTCYVFPDSIDAFRKFRKLVQDAGKELGWRPKLDQDQLIFSTHGTSPDPQ